MKAHKNNWFTLVELIVVITIVWILSTVWFVAYSWYLSWARDSNRISQLTKISDSLQTYAASKSLPLPDDYIEITASGASNVIAYQWYVWVDVLETIDYTNGWRDPKDDSYFTYFLSRDRKSLQLLALMEEQSKVTFTNWILVNALNFENRYPKTYWNKLWVLVSWEESTLNTPAQEISTNSVNGYLDLVSTTQNYISVIDDWNAITWTWRTLKSLSWLISSDWKWFACNEIYLKNKFSTNWIYTIFAGWYTFDVLCHFDSEWGWTLLDGVSDNIWKVISEYVSDPNLGNYSMQEKYLKWIVNRNNDTATFKYDISNNTEDIKLYIALDIKQALKSENYAEAENNSNIKSESWVTYNNWNLAQKKIKKSYTRLVLRNDNDEDYQGHIKTYSSWWPHGWWVWVTWDYLWQLYLNKSILSVDPSSLPTFWWLFHWGSASAFSDNLYLMVTGESYSTQWYNWHQFNSVNNQWLTAWFWIK